MLATATGNCAVTNVTYNENKYYVVAWTFYLDAVAPTPVTTSDRSYVSHCLLFPQRCSVKVRQVLWLKLLLKPTLDLLPRKCTYAKVMDLRNMVLWSIRFVANRYRISPHQISLCPLLAVCLFVFWALIKKTDVKLYEKRRPRVLSNINRGVFGWFACK